jgi:hypothetical protein
MTNPPSEPERFETRAIHAGQEPDERNGAVMTPVYFTSTYEQDAPAQPRGGYEYSRTSNPTRTALQENLASLEGGAWGLCFSSGLAATNALLDRLVPGDHVVAGNDLYGGTYRLFTRVFERYVWPLLRANGVRVLPELLSVRNDFFGASVTCSGLLVGADIVRAVRESGGDPRTTFIPPNCLNYDNVTIDAMTVDDLSRELGAPVVAPADSFIDALCEHAVSGAAEA